MLDIVVMRHYIHKQPYSIICNPKYIYNKKIYATANIYITKNMQQQIYIALPSSCSFTPKIRIPEIMPNDHQSTA